MGDDMNKFFDWYFTGRWLRHPMVVAIVFYTIGYFVGKS
jgi:hypothetical protein